MCGIAGLHLINPDLYPQLGTLLGGMLSQAAGRGNDSAGVGIYTDPSHLTPGQATVCVLDAQMDATAAAKAVAAQVPWLEGLTAESAGQTTVIRALTDPASLETVVRAALDHATVISRGHSLTVLKGTGEPDQLAQDWNL
ncbi:MAG: hypothetical protein LBO75_03620, partial [Bifidobacteriaceae bacterium]|nr:hypothetical protein [Bifidobacteriaceae bacterium]